MEDIVAYIILAVFGLITFYVLWHSRHRTKKFPLSSQVYTDCDLNVSSFKRKGKFSMIYLQFHAKKKMRVKNVVVELIDKKRSFNYVGLEEILEDSKIPADLTAGGQLDFKLSIKDFKIIINRTDIPYKTFRLVVENENEKKFKSHKLAFNKSGVVYRPDSGNYN